MSKITRDYIKQLNNYGIEGVVGKRYLELAKKDERGIPRSTGAQQVKLIKEELVDDIRIYTGKETFKEVRGIRYWFETNDGVRCYDVPALQKDCYKDEKLPKVRNYLLDKFADIEIGDVLIMEYIQKGVGEGYIDIKKINGDNNENIDTGNSAEDGKEALDDKGEIEENPFGY